VAEGRCFIQQGCLPKVAITALSKLKQENTGNQVVLSTDPRDKSVVDLSQIIGKCQVMKYKLFKERLTLS